MLGVGFVPKNVPNYYVVPVIAFGLAVQNASFSKIEGMGYNNAFTTGNLKKSVVAWSAYFFGEDKSQHNAAVNYMFLVIAFALGAIVSALLQMIKLKVFLLIKESSLVHLDYTSCNIYYVKQNIKIYHICN